MPKAKLTKLKKNDPGAIETRNAQSTAGVQSNYGEQQDDEIEVLRSIFPEDFEQTETREAWSKKTERSFKLKLLAESDATLSSSLSVTFTATYPKTAPLLSAEFSDAVPEKTREKVQDIVTMRPKQLVGEVMILELSNDVREILEDAAQALAQGRAVPSLEEERAKREAEVEKLAQEEQERELKRIAEDRAEEERLIQQKADAELKRRDDERKKHQYSVANGQSQHSLKSADIVFDHPVRQALSDGRVISFQAVEILRNIKSQSATEIFDVRPVIKEDNEIPGNIPKLIVKRLTIYQQRARKLVLDLEAVLEKLKSIDHENLLNTLDFKLDHNDSLWRFDVLSEMAAGPSLRDVLKITTTISVPNARAYATDILRGLDYLHKHGIVHGSLNESNVFVCDSDAGKIAKLADACSQSIHYSIPSYETSTGSDRSLARYPPGWVCPEFVEDISWDQKTAKTDIWDFGIIIAKMILGEDVVKRHQPEMLTKNMALTGAFRDLISDALRNDPRRRPNAFDMIPYEFLRTDVEATEQNAAMKGERSLNPRQSSYQRGLTENAVNATGNSRYASEWFELGRLGRGGYGHVMKARNKADGRVYAIKKIADKTQAQLSEVLSEVYMLATLNHPYVVRYYAAWPEEEHVQGNVGEEVSNAISETTCDDGTQPSPATETQARMDFSHSVPGLDFISSAGYPKIEFGDSDESDMSSADNDDSILERDGDRAKQTGADPVTGASALNVRRANKATLFIQMEFCEKLTLRDIIRRGIQDNVDEIWRIFRQVVEGLTHIHSHGIIHRDLKPENIFIDLSSNPKIGDFGLATTGQGSLRQHSSETTVTNRDEMTLSVGTALYVAPELKSTASGVYTEKVDMYSLGIIFFEMCYPLQTGMERVQMLSQLRLREHSLPITFQASEKLSQAAVLEDLVKHKPSERPSSAELLRSGKIPVRVEDEQIRQALSSLSDPSSPYFGSVMNTLFSQSSNNQLQDRLWDANGDALMTSEATEYVLIQGMVKERMTSVFRRYGAVETSRQTLFPRSTLYVNNDVAQFIDSSGALIQLPYDLILPYARMVAREAHLFPRSFAFGTVYRSTVAGGAPRTNREADFDIVSNKNQDLALAEAEVMKCLDDLIQEFPCFSKTPMCFHLSHSMLLRAILDFCRVPKIQHAVTMDVLGKLRIGSWTWQKIRAELRAPSIAIPSSSLDDLAQFDFRETPEKAFKKLQTIFKDTSQLHVVHTVFTHVSGLVEYLKRFGISRRVFFSPLSSLNEKFYRSQIMFQCLFDTKKRDILAAGGRYDSLIKDQQPFYSTPTSTFSPHAVGTNIAWDRIVTSMVRHQRQSNNVFLKRPDAFETPISWYPRRADVLIASFDPATLRSVGIKLVGELRAHDIAAELAIDALSTDELLSHYRNDKHSWIVIIKHEGFASGRPDLKVRSMENRGESTDIQSSELINYLRSEIREREQKEGNSDRARLTRQASRPESTGKERKNDVHVLIASHKSKKPNKTRIIQDAQDRVKDLLAGQAEDPIAAVETRDEIIEKLRDTKLSDADSWRKVIQSLPLSDRQYCHDLMDLIVNFKVQYGDGSRKCFIFNFRTGFCIDYDLQR